MYSPVLDSDAKFGDSRCKAAVVAVQQNEASIIEFSIIDDSVVRRCLDLTPSPVNLQCEPKTGQHLLYGDGPLLATDGESYDEAELSL